MAKPTVLIVHGTKGSPQGNWFPWLRSELEKRGYDVIVPSFPTPDGQNLQNWLKIFETYKKSLGPDSILVGHSIGSTFLLSAIQRLDVPVKAAFLVSGFIATLGIPGYDELNKTFVEADFDWIKIKKSCRKFYCISSDNDPYVPREKGKALADKLGVEPIIIKGAGHINADSGFTRFPHLLELILSGKAY